MATKTFSKLLLTLAQLLVILALVSNLISAGAGPGQLAPQKYDEESFGELIEELPECACNRSTKSYNPVCASNSKTYGNYCVYECAAGMDRTLECCCMGECPCGPDSKPCEGR